MRNIQFKGLKFILLYILLVFFSKIHGQGICDTPATSDNMTINQLISNSSNFGNNLVAPKTLRVYFHVIRKSDKSGGTCQIR